jgi:hypothetical protein
MRRFTDLIRFSWDAPDLRPLSEREQAVLKKWG